MRLGEGEGWGEGDGVEWRDLPGEMIECCEGEGECGE
jgi:hypothetical protein